MRGVACLLGVLMLTACGSGGDNLEDGAGSGSVTAITGPLEAYVPSVFVLHGTGFGAGGTTAQVRFTATNGDTPFEGYTAATATVDVDVLSSTRAIGVTPAAGSLAFTATVELLPAAGGVREGPGVLASFNERIAILGGPDDDTLVGTPGPDMLDGGVGRDSLYGGGGNDDLYGNVDSDNLHGEAGDDTLTGGAGRDGFHFTPGAGHDTITDLQMGVDRLLIHGTSGGLAALSLIGGVTDSGPGGDVVLQWTAGGSVTMQAFGSGTIAHLADLIELGIQVLVLP